MQLILCKSSSTLSLFLITPMCPTLCFWWKENTNAGWKVVSALQMPHEVTVYFCKVKTVAGESVQRLAQSNWSEHFCEKLRKAAPTTTTALFRDRHPFILQHYDLINVLSLCSTHGKYYKSTDQKLMMSTNKSHTPLGSSRCPVDSFTNVVFMQAVCGKSATDLFVCLFFDLFYLIRFCSDTMWVHQSELEAPLCATDVSRSRNPIMVLNHALYLCNNDTCEQFIIWVYILQHNRCGIKTALTVSQNNPKTNHKMCSDA